MWPPPEVPLAALQSDERADLEACRVLADWARIQGYLALHAPSAAAEDERVLAIYPENLPARLDLRKTSATLSTTQATPSSMTRVILASLSRTSVRGSPEYGTRRRGTSTGWSGSSNGGSSRCRFPGSRPSAIENLVGGCMRPEDGGRSELAGRSSEPTASPKEIVLGTIAAVLGFFGLVALFSDYSSLIGWIVELSLLFAVFPFVLGYLAPVRWWMGLFVSWGAVLLFVFLLVVERNPLVLLAICVAVALPLASSYAGAGLRRWLAVRPRGAA